MIELEGLSLKTLKEISKRISFKFLSLEYIFNYVHTFSISPDDVSDKVYNNCNKLCSLILL